MTLEMKKYNNISGTTLKQNQVFPENLLNILLENWLINVFTNRKKERKTNEREERGINKTRQTLIKKQIQIYKSIQKILGVVILLKVCQRNFCRKLMAQILIVSDCK